MRAVIVASGPSAKGFVPPAGVTVIAVNGAIEWLSRADYFFTLDFSQANMRRLLHQREGTRYTYAYTERAYCLKGEADYYQRIAGRPFNNPEYLSAQWWANRWGCRLGLCEVENKIHTGNSAWGALGLAYHLGCSRVALVGVDASSDQRIEGGRPNNLNHLPLLFESAIGQIDFVNCGAMRSAVPSMSINKGMDWLCE